MTPPENLDKPETYDPAEGVNEDEGALHGITPKPGGGGSYKRLALPVVIGLLVIGLVAGGLVWALNRSQEVTQQANPYESCKGTLDVIDKYLFGLGAAVEGVPPQDVFKDSATAVGFIAVYQAYELSQCDPDDITSGLDWDSMNEATKAVMWSLLADLASARDDFDEPPAQAQALAGARQGANGEPAIVAPAGLQQGELILVFADGTCDGCYEPFAAALTADYADLAVYIVNESSTSRELAAKYGWELVDRTEVPITNLLDVRPAAAVIRDGVAITWISGEGAFQEPAADLEELVNPIDRSKEPVHAQYLQWYGTCDGYQGAGVVINATDRPINAVITTDPSVKFDQDGLPLSSLVYHDLGEIEPWGYKTFDILTGADVYAPCWIQADGFYTDGEDRRGADWSPDVPPAGFIEDPKVLIGLEELDMPNQVIPAGYLPSADDVIQLKDGPPPPSEELPPPDGEAPPSSGP